MNPEQAKEYGLVDEILTPREREPKPAASLRR